MLLLQFMKLLNLRLIFFLDNVNIQYQRFVCHIIHRLHFFIVSVQMPVKHERQLAQFLRIILR